MTNFHRFFVHIKIPLYGILTVGIIQCKFILIIMILPAVTERVYEVVSTDASTDEEEKSTRPEAHIKTEKCSPPKQTKQASLTSFFKR